MREDKGIPILNVYYMLAYAFEFADEAFLRRVGSEEFENQQELLAFLLDEGIGKQLKRGLCRVYVPRQEGILSVRGRIIMAETMNNRFSRSREIECAYDELSEDNAYNQILKAAAMLLIKSPGVGTATKDALKKKMLFFANVSAVRPNTVDWESLRFDRNNRTYEFLLNICRMIMAGMLMKDSAGADVLAPEIREEQMHRLYERFILKYYQRHWKKLRPAAQQIPWALDDGHSAMLPIMQSDIVLTSSRAKLIIDAKYYTSTLQHQSRWGSDSIRSDNLYQIFAYVKNAAASNPSLEVSGMLLYAKTRAEAQPGDAYRMHGNEIHVRTLNLGCEFEAVSEQLDEIARLVAEGEE